MAAKLKTYHRYVLLLFVFTVLVISFLIIRPLITPILSGILLAYLFYPFYKWFLNKIMRSQENWAKTIASFVTIFMIVLVVVGPAITLFLGLLSQYKRISGFILEMIPQVLHFISENTPGYINDLNQGLGINVDFPKMVTGVTTQGLSLLQELLTQIPAFILGSFISLFIVYYLLKNSKEAFAWLQHFLPLSEARYKIIRKRFKDLGRGMVASQFAIAITQGLLATICFWIIGMKHFVLLGLLTMLMALIPFLGAIAVWLTVFVFLLLQIPSGVPAWKPTFLFFYGALIISTVDNILRPKLMSQSTKIHPAIILIGLLGGLILFGIPGILIGPLVLGLSDIALEVYQESL